MGAIREAHGPRKAAPVRARKVSGPTRVGGGTRHRMFFLAAATLLFGTGVAAANSSFPSATWGAAREIFASWLGGESSPRRAPRSAKQPPSRYPPVALSGIPEVASTAPSPEPDMVPEVMPSAHPFAEPLDHAHPPARKGRLTPRSSPNVPPQPLSSDVTTAASAVSPGNVASPSPLTPTAAPSEPTRDRDPFRALRARQCGAPTRGPARGKRAVPRFSEPLSGE